MTRGAHGAVAFGAQVEAEAAGSRIDPPVSDPNAP